MTTLATSRLTAKPLTGRKYPEVCPRTVYQSVPVFNLVVKSGFYCERRSETGDQGKKFDVRARHYENLIKAYPNHFAVLSFLGFRKSDPRSFCVHCVKAFLSSAAWKHAQGACSLCPVMCTSVSASCCRKFYGSSIRSYTFAVYMCQCPFAVGH